MTTKTHTFTLYLSGVDLLADEHMDALYEAGCDDALFGERDSAQYATFDRNASSFTEALTTALRDIEAALPAATIVRIEPDQMVTLAAIAERSGRSREYIRLLAAGQRGPGGFPAPIAYVDHKTRLWHWPDVAHWLTSSETAKVEVDIEAADLVATLNAAYALREHIPQLRDERDVVLVTAALGDHIAIRK